ncbi:MAG: peptidoglycan DL-endopeptidase CwlO [Gaiellales bacterium]|nr:peptidoglycan DL-endopeptidase CwlO [Gaiellales bacterium]
MFAARGQARAAGRARVSRVSAALLILTTLLLSVSLTQAAASPTIASKRAEAKQVALEIQDMQSRLEKQIERYDAVHQRYLDTRRKLRDNRMLLSVAKSNLARAQQLLANSLTNAYKTTDTGQDVVSYLLAAHSFNELVDHVQLLQRSNDANSALISQIANTKHEITVRTAELKVQTAQLRSDTAEQLAAKHRVEAGLSHLEARKARISADIQHLIDQQQARADATARTLVSSGGSDVNIPIPPSSTIGGQAVAVAMQYLGVPYVWGGASPSGFDCSGLTMYVWGQLGVSLPHNAAAQYGYGSPVPRDALEPGDLVFFDGLGHVGIYVGSNAFIHAPHTGDVVRISSMSGWYSDNYVGARRVG